MPFRRSATVPWHSNCRNSAPDHRRNPLKAAPAHVLVESRYSSDMSEDTLPIEPAHILVVDDEPAIRSVLREGLEAEGWTVSEADNRKTLMAALDSPATPPVDLITLDLILGGEDGLLLAREIREHRNLPILMITGKSTPYDRVRGLENGADDYIVKPFLIREVVLRVRRTLDTYRHEVDSDEPILFDHSAFDLKRRVVKHLDGTPVELTELELKLFELFIRHPGRILSRDDISRALHGREWSPYDRTIDGHVARLRKKIEPRGDAPVLIRSVRGVGYVFTADVKPPAQS